MDRLLPIFIPFFNLRPSHTKLKARKNLAEIWRICVLFESNWNCYKGRRGGQIIVRPVGVGDKERGNHLHEESIVGPLVLGVNGGDAVHLVMRIHVLVFN